MKKVSDFGSGVQVSFPFRGSKTIEAAFDAEPISSDGGAILLRQVDRRLGFIQKLAGALSDERDERYVDHDLVTILRQRIFQIALGYEDANDANTLRSDPVLKACCGRDPVRDPDLASQPTISRIENATDPISCYWFSEALVEAYIARQKGCPHLLVLDLDLTNDPTHGQQELNFFHAYYGGYVYLPFLIFDQDGDLITAVLLPGKWEGTEKLIPVLARVLKRLKAKWPGIRILLRGDSAFSAPPMYQLCKRFHIDFLFGIGKNSRLAKRAEKLQKRARRKYLRTGEKARLFTSVRYRALRYWPRFYRVVIKAEEMAEGSNVRFVVTNLPGRSAALYDRYVERGESCENSIKDLKNVLAADRLSCHRFYSNQFRLLLHASAYVLMFALRRLTDGTEMAKAQMDTLRLHLLKIGTQVRSTVRQISFHFSASFPWQEIWQLIARRSLHPVPTG